MTTLRARPRASVQNAPAECISATKQDIEASGIIAPIVGHVGDGNFHCVVLLMMDDPEEISRAEAFLDRLVDRALAMEGTCTGEHGIGQGKMRFLVREHGQTTVDAMAAIKHALDPGGIMNPGKVVPAPDGDRPAGNWPVI